MANRPPSVDSDLPVGRLAVVCCAVPRTAGAVVALAVGFLLYPVLPPLLHRDSGGVFYLVVGCLRRSVLYGRAKSWIVISYRERTPKGPAA